MDAFERVLEAFEEHANALRAYRLTKNFAERAAKDPNVKPGTVTVEERERTLADAKIKAKEAFDAYVRELIQSGSE